jgi:AbrB family looped-hinge helix DNA binding protein
MKTHAEKIREAVTDLGEADPNQIMEWVRKHYPEDPINPQSYRADIIGCSINHTSQHHYPNMPKFLLFDNNTKKYRLYSSENNKTASTLPASERVEFFSNDILTEQLGKITEVHSHNSTCIDGVLISKLSITGQIDIPQKIRENMGLNPGDTIAFIATEKGVEIRKARLKLEFT